MFKSNEQPHKHLERQYASPSKGSAIRARILHINLNGENGNGFKMLLNSLRSLSKSKTW